MDFTQAQLLLDKAKSLVKNMAADPKSVAQIEKDLLKSYLRQLYDLVEDNKQPVAKTTTATRTTPAAPKRKAYKPPRVIEVPESIKQLEEEVVVQPTPPQPKPKPVPPPPAPAPAPAARPKTGKIPGEYAGLFSIPAAKELSEKLSATPLKDLKKGMSINDKLLYQEALFNKDNAAFTGALDTLNNMDGMDAAKLQLVEYAKTNGWMEEERVPVAQAFIKHVSRRYL